MSINGFGLILKSYENRLREIGLPENEIAYFRGRAIAECAMKLPMTPLQERLRIAKLAMDVPNVQANSAAPLLAQSGEAKVERRVGRERMV